MGPELILLIVVLVIVIFWRGPSTLPKLGEALGKAVKGVRDNMPDNDKGEAADPGSTDDSGDPTASGPRPGS